MQQLYSKLEMKAGSLSFPCQLKDIQWPEYNATQTIAWPLCFDEKILLSSFMSMMKNLWLKTRSY